MVVCLHTSSISCKLVDVNATLPPSDRSDFLRDGLLHTDHSNFSDHSNFLRVGFCYQDRREWESQQWSSGFVRKTSLRCNNAGNLTTSDGFMELSGKSIALQGASIRRARVSAVLDGLSQQLLQNHIFYSGLCQHALLYILGCIYSI